MSENPHNNRHITNGFMQLGPYLRPEQSDEGRYFFDCLAVCLNLKADPEQREFWGWWLVLVPCEGGFTMSGEFGLYTKDGIWDNHVPPESVMPELTRSRENFMRHLQELLAGWQMELFPGPASLPLSQSA